jgi:hypothetical protein
MHLQAVGPQTYLIQEPLGIFYPSFRSHITFQVMTIPDKSTGYHYAVGSLFKSL